MGKRKLISFSVDDNQMETPEEINNSQFCKARMKCFSDGLTKHGYSFTLDSLKSAEFSILGKPLLWAYSIWTDDASGHEDSEVPCGFISKDAKDADITYEYDENVGKTFMYVNCYIWKVYAEKLVEIFARTDDIKDVSTELWLLDTIDHNKDNIEVTKFIYTGVTILGEDVNPACVGANIEIIKFSENEFSKAKEQFEKQLNNSLTNEPLEDGSFFMEKNNTKNKEEENLVNKKLENSADGNTPDVLENARAIVRTSVSISQDTDVYEDNGDFIGNEFERHTKETTTVQEIPDMQVNVNEMNNNPDGTCANSDSNTNTDDAIQTNSDDGATIDSNADVVTDKNSTEESLIEKYSALEAKFAEKEAEYSALQKSYAALELKCSTLQEYKNNKENEAKTVAVECALNDVSDILTAEEIAQWREKSLNCSSVDSFKNELKAYAFDLQKNSNKKPADTLRNSIPHTEVEETGNVWDRLSKLI